ncbi:Predicted transporter [Methanobrevibacter olleyae]|uniref:Predicted transporter n=1 Tax=Methanobrevibacter olleyae TaxID=294671 RepID=A0A1I4J2H8_METOL|nr:Predicted transporter [Methanobrevibacter olleyae]
MAFSLLWSLGLIISIVIFAIAFGLILSLNNFSEKDLAKFSIISFISTFILIYFINLFKIQLNLAIGHYNYLLLFLIAFLLILSGYLINKDKDIKKSFKSILILSFICFIIMAFMCIISKQALFGLNSLEISLLTSISFLSLLIILCFVFKKINLNISYKEFGSLYYILGIYSLIVSLFIPNIISLDLDKISPINIVSIESILLTIILLVIVIVLGLFYYKKNSIFR